MWMMMSGDFALHARAVYVGGTALVASRVRQGAYSNREGFSLGLRSGLGRYARGGGDTRREAGNGRRATAATVGAAQGRGRTPEDP